MNKGNELFVSFLLKYYTKLLIDLDNVGVVRLVPFLHRDTRAALAGGRIGDACDQREHALLFK